MQIADKRSSPYAAAIMDQQLDEILKALSAREPLFHRREFGTSRADLERIIDDAFWEIGASGSIYRRDFVIETLLERYSRGPEPHDWPCRDFSLTPLATDLFLLSYILEEPKRVTRRSTIWRSTNEGWKVVFHQGTPMQA